MVQGGWLIIPWRHGLGSCGWHPRGSGMVRIHAVLMHRCHRSAQPVLALCKISHTGVRLQHGITQGGASVFVLQRGPVVIVHICSQIQGECFKLQFNKSPECKQHNSKKISRFLQCSLEQTFNYHLKSPKTERSLKHKGNEKAFFCDSHLEIKYPFLSDLCKAKTEFVKTF